MNTADKLAEALRDAATSLETIGRLAGKPYYGRDDQGEPIQTYMGHNDEVRSYAKSRAGCAREALAAYEALAAHDAEQEPCHDAWRAALAQRREPLTDAEIEEILHGEIALNPGEGCAGRFARAIERAHGIGATTGKEPGNV